MKSLSLQVPHVIFVIGIPGSGKTFFAEHFASTFNTPIVSHHRLGEQLFGDQPADKTEQGIVAQLAAHMLVQLLKTGHSIVVDGGAMSRGERQELQRILKPAGYEPLLVWVQTEQYSARQRATRQNRFATDRSHPISDDQFDAASQRFVPPTKTEKHVVVSGRHTYPGQLRVVLKKLTFARQAAPIAPATRPDTKSRITIK